jgi:uncharacterized lipoprotein YmbA
LFLVGVLLSGCTASKPTTFYVLTAKAPEKGFSEVKSPNGQCPEVEIGPISLPGYLDGSAIMTRAGPNRLHLSELHHWAEPLRESFARVLAENLNSRLCGGEVPAVSRSRRDGAELRVRVDVLRFEPLQRERVLLRARWTVWRTGSGEAGCIRLSSYEPPIEGTGHQDAVAAMSEAAASLSRDIAACLSRYSPELGNP